MSSIDKRKIEQKRVRRSIEEALFALLKDQRFSEITVTDIVREANVARASYYRNFDSKEAIIKSYMAHQRQDVADKIDFSETFSDFFIQEKLIASLEHYLKQKYYILLLCDNGFDSLILDDMNKFAELFIDNNPHSPFKNYKIQFLTGGIFNMTIQWLKNGAIESPRELSDIFIRLLRSDPHSLQYSSSVRL